MSRAFRILIAALALVAGCVLGVASDTEAGSPLGSPSRSPIQSPIPSQGAPAWTPLKLSNQLGWWAPDRVTAAQRVLVGSDLDSIQDSSGLGLTWTAASSARRCGWVASATGGKPAIQVRSSNTSAMSTSAGGVTGNHSYAIFGLMELTGIGNGGEIGAVLNLGLSGGTRLLGGWTGSLWGGGTSDAARYDVGSYPGYPTQQIPPYPATPTSLHLWAHIYDSATGKAQIYWDGQPAGALETVTPALIAGSGLGVYNGSNIGNGLVYQALLLSDIPSSFAVSGLRQRSPSSEWWQVEKFMAAVNPSYPRPTMVIGIGDSMTAASNLALGIRVANNYLQRMAEHAVADQGKATPAWLDFGSPGATSAQILATMTVAPAGALMSVTPINPKRIASIYMGTNDVIALTGGTPTTCSAAILSGYQSAITTARAYGTTGILIYTLHQLVTMSADQHTCNTTANTAIRLLAGGDVAVVELANLTADYADGVHFASGVGANYDIMGSRAAAAAAAAGLLQIGPGPTSGVAALALLAGLVLASRRRVTPAVARRSVGTAQPRPRPHTTRGPGSAAREASPASRATTHRGAATGPRVEGVSPGRAGSCSRSRARSYHCQADDIDRAA